MRTKATRPGVTTALFSSCNPPRELESLHNPLPQLGEKSSAFKPKILHLIWPPLLHRSVIQHLRCCVKVLKCYSRMGDPPLYTPTFCHRVLLQALELNDTTYAYSLSALNRNKITQCSHLECGLAKTCWVCSVKPHCQPEAPKFLKSSSMWLWNVYTFCCRWLEAIWMQRMDCVVLFCTYLYIFFVCP